MNKTEFEKKVKVINDPNQKEYISPQDAEMDARAVEAVKTAIAKARFCKKPIAKYDIETGRAYLEYSNGEKQYVN